jgi:hypothetical protein
VHGGDCGGLLSGFYPCRGGPCRSPPARSEKKCSWDPDMWERTGVYAAEKEGGVS